jgi:hypothetical protein
MLAGYSKVSQQNSSLVVFRLSNQNVGRFDVAMQQSLLDRKSVV